MGNGFVKLPRDIYKWRWHHDPRMLSVAMFLLLRAQYRDESIGNVDLNVGEALVSLEAIAAWCGITVRQVRTAIDRLKSTDGVTTRTTNHYTIINLTNWELWAYNDDESDKQNDKQNDKQATRKRQTSDKRTTLNKTYIHKDDETTKTGKQDIPPIVPQGDDDGFDAFWQIYPRKVGKAAARKAYKKLHPSDGLQALMLTAIREQMQSTQWRKDGGQFIPNPTTWLTQGRWDDELRRSTGNVFADLAINTGNRIADMVQRGYFDDDTSKKTGNGFADLILSGAFDDDEPASNTL